MLEEEFHVLTDIEEGKVIGGGSGSGGGGYGSGGGGMGSGDPYPLGCGPFSSAQLDFIKTAEGGCYDEPYWDDEGECWTIGVGHKLTVAEHQAIVDGTLQYSHTQLMNMFKADVAQARDEVNDVVTNGNVTNDMLLAMTDLVFNAGTSDFDSSNLVAAINSGNFSEASNEFEHWNADQVNGLDVRRANEQNMFDTYSTGGDYSYQWGVHTDYWNSTHDD